MDDVALNYMSIFPLGDIIGVLAFGSYHSLITLLGKYHW